MPAVPVVIDIVVTNVIADAIELTIAEAIGNALVADIVTGAISHAVGSAAASAFEGGNIGKAAISGAKGGAIGAAASAAAGKLFPDIPKGASETEKALYKAGKSAASGALTGIASGQKPKEALQRGLISGAGTAVGEYFFPTDETKKPSLGERIARGSGQALLGYGLSGGLTPQQQAQTAGGAALPTAQQAPQELGTGGVSALSQALRTAPDLGYSPSAAMLGGGESDKPSRKVWNVSSLKLKEE